MADYLGSVSKREQRKTGLSDHNRAIETGECSQTWQHREKPTVSVMTIARGCYTAARIKREEQNQTQIINTQTLTNHLTHSQTKTKFSIFSGEKMALFLFLSDSYH